MSENTPKPPHSNDAESTPESAQGDSTAPPTEASATTESPAPIAADDVTLDAISTPPIPANVEEVPAFVANAPEDDVTDAFEFAKVESDERRESIETPADDAAANVALQSNPIVTDIESGETGNADDSHSAPALEAEAHAFAQRMPEEAGVRAERRVREGWRMTSSFGAAIAAAAILPPLAILASVIAYPSAKPAPLPPAPAVELQPVTTSLDAAEKMARQAGERERELLTAVLAARAQQSVDKVGRAIAVAREVRRKDGKKGAQLATAFSAAELSKLPKQLGDDSEGRVVIHRDGTRVFGDIDLPAAFVKSETPDGEDAAVVVENGRIFVRRCVANEKTCVIESDPLLLEPIAVAAGRQAVDETTNNIAAFTAALGNNSDVTAPSTVEERRLWTIGLALLLAVLAAALIVRALRQRVAIPMAMATQRAFLLAQGRDQSGDHNGVREVSDVHAALDAVAGALEQQRQEVEAAEVKRERLTHLADTLDAIARGETRARAEVTGSVTEQSLATATNRLADALERHATRLASHLEVFSSPTNANTTGLAKRVSALKPLPPLMADIGQRLTALSSHPSADESMKRDLVRLAEAVRSRAKTATALYQALEQAVANGGAPIDSTALEKLREDLRLFSEAPAFPTLLFSLATGPSPLDAGEIAARLRPPLSQPPSPAENAPA